MYRTLIDPALSKTLLDPPAHSMTIPYLFGSPRIILDPPRDPPGTSQILPDLSGSSWTLSDPPKPYKALTDLLDQPRHTWTLPNPLEPS